MRPKKNGKCIYEETCYGYHPYKEPGYKKTREEIIQYPDRIVGTVSCVPDYEEWGNGDRPAVKVDGRIWIKVR